MSYESLWILFLASLVLMIKPGPYMMTFISLASIGNWRSILIVWWSYVITASGLYVVLLKSLSVLQIGMGVYFLIFKCAAAMLFVSLGLMGLNRSTKADQLAAQQQTEELTTGSILARSTAGVMLALSNPYEFVWIITVIPVLLGTMTFSFVDIYVIRSVTIWADILVQSSYIIPILYFRRYFSDNTLKYVRVVSSLILIGIGLYLFASIAFRWDLAQTDLLSS